MSRRPRWLLASAVPGRRRRCHQMSRRPRWLLPLAVPGALFDPERADRLADEVAPFVAHLGLVRRRCLGHGEAGAAEHPERELDQAVERLVAEVAGLDQVLDEPLHQPVGVVLLALPPAVPT